jgi:hypothetical protein
VCIGKACVRYRTRPKLHIIGIAKPPSPFLHFSTACLPALSHRWVNQSKPGVSLSLCVEIPQLRAIPRPRLVFSMAVQHEPKVFSPEYLDRYSKSVLILTGSNELRQQRSCARHVTRIMTAMTHVMYKNPSSSLCSS